MDQSIPEGPGSAHADLQNKAAQWWSESAKVDSHSANQLGLQTPLASRIRHARRAGWEIGTIYSRFSTKLQHSTDDQVRECVQWAGRSGIYVPPELISVDEGVKGKRLR